MLIKVLEKMFHFLGKDKGRWKSIKWKREISKGKGKKIKGKRKREKKWRSKGSNLSCLRKIGKLMWPKTQIIETKLPSSDKSFFSITLSTPFNNSPPLYAYIYLCMNCEFISVYTMYLNVYVRRLLDILYIHIRATFCFC